MSNTSVAPAASTNVQAAPAASQSERFTNAVMKEFTSNAGDLQITPFQKKLIQNYFIRLDQTLKEAEIKRMAKRESEREPLAYTWENVNMQKLATDVIAFSAVGLDPVQPNHINVIPYKNNSTSKYDVTFIMGYRGLELKAMKYGFEIPDDVIVQLVYTNDKFRSIKKSWNNRVETYEFEIVDDFERGEVRGGFYYHSFNDRPEKNKLVVFTLKDIEKRKPKYASAEFWGGEKAVWKNGQKTGTETIEGWFEEMCFKTIYRAAYNDITIDSQKIDDHFVRMIQSENDNVATKVQNEIEQNAHKKEMSFEDAQVVDNVQSSRGNEASMDLGSNHNGQLFNEQNSVVNNNKGPAF